MSAVFSFLADMPLIYLFLVVGLGAALGQIPFGKVRLGAAMVLFAAIGITAAGVAFGTEIAVPAVVGDLGLAIFAFAIGITSGPNFFHSLRTSWPLMLGVAAMLIAAGAVAVPVGRVLGLDAGTIAGAYAGALTNTPALAAAGGTPEATVAYSVTYIFGVLGVLVAVSAALSYGKKDSDVPQELIELAVRVERTDHPVADALVRIHDGRVRFNRIRRTEEGPTEILDPDTELRPGDVVTVVGPEQDVAQVARELGHRSSHQLSADRRELDFRRMTISNPKLAGRAIRELHLEKRFGATISRIRRGDVDMVAMPDSVLQLGDRIRVIAHRDQMTDVTHYVGDSARGLSDINPVAGGLGLTLGLTLGHLPLPLPGGGTFMIGAAAGTLILGLIMGRIGRIGKVITTLPNTAAMTLMEFGLLVFLAYAGTRAGGQIAVAFTSGAWWRILILGVVITLVMSGLAYLVGRWVFRSGGTRLGGMIAGMQTQPALLAYANGRTNFDPRVGLGYALAYPTAMVTKILVATVLSAL
ncbi:aspartate:alanine exchanger family transporter [Granulicoccus sp. GXG6511]|uniref:aspartate:alanine exchanger family transporter n=1 Tax=Granulicoccus sp. GXG6511 TaxID=3381351 RepID=UPI003D7D304B